MYAKQPQHHHSAPSLLLPEYERYEARQTIEARIGMLQQKKLWLRFAEAQRDLVEAKEKVKLGKEQLRKRQDELKEDVGPIQWVAWGVLMLLFARTFACGVRVCVQTSGSSSPTTLHHPTFCRRLEVYLAEATAEKTAASKELVALKRKLASNSSAIEDAKGEADAALNLKTSLR